MTTGWGRGGAPTPRQVAFSAIGRERERQDLKWGQQNLPDGTGTAPLADAAEDFREACQRAFADGSGTWRHVLLEEVYEALAEEDPARLREELVQSAAVIVAWIEHIDRRPTSAP